MIYCTSLLGQSGSNIYTILLTCYAPLLVAGKEHLRMLYNWTNWGTEHLTALYEWISKEHLRVESTVQLNKLRHRTPDSTVWVNQQGTPESWEYCTTEWNRAWKIPAGEHLWAESTVQLNETGHGKSLQENTWELRVPYNWMKQGMENLCRRTPESWEYCTTEWNRAWKIPAGEHLRAESTVQLNETGHGKSPQELRGNFLLPGQLSVLTYFSIYSTPVLPQ